TGAVALLPEELRGRLLRAAGLPARARPGPVTTSFRRGHHLRRTLPDSLSISPGERERLASAAGARRAQHRIRSPAPDDPDRRPGATDLQSGELAKAPARGGRRLAPPRRSDLHLQGRRGTGSCAGAGDAIRRRAQCGRSAFLPTFPRVSTVGRLDGDVL